MDPEEFAPNHALPFAHRMALRYGPRPQTDRERTKAARKRTKAARKARKKNRR